METLSTCAAGNQDGPDSKRENTRGIEAGQYYSEVFSESPGDF